MTSAAPETADRETSSDGYAARFAGPVGQWMLGVQETIVMAWIRRRAPASILDVGGGHGQLALPLARAGYAVTVLGTHPDCARRLQAELAAGRLKFVSGDVVALPFPDRTFDVVLSVRLLPHCVRWPELICELCRVARTAVILDYPVSQGWHRAAPRLFGLKRRLEGNTRTWRAFRHDEVQTEFARHGFCLHGRAGQFCLPMVLHRALGRQSLSARLEQWCLRRGLTARWGSPVLVEMERANLI